MCYKENIIPKSSIERNVTIKVEDILNGWIAYNSVLIFENYNKMAIF